MSRKSNDPQWTLFEAQKQPPPGGSHLFIPNMDPAEFGWDEIVSRVLPPQVVTPVTPDDHARGVFLTGAQALRLVGARREIQPQQLLQADVLNLGRKFTGILQPRRATKTSGILAWMIGRCLMEPETSAAFTICTTGKATRQKYIKEVVPPLERTWPYEDDRPMKILKGAGAEMLKFANGSFLSFVPFKGESFRSDAFDIIVLDEAQDPDPEEAGDVLTAILPTLDTRPGAQLVIAGTAGEYRESNMLWDELTEGEAGDPRHASLIYRAPVDHDNVDVEALVSEWETVEQLVRECHPGVHSGLTPMDAVYDNWKQWMKKRKPKAFAAEYLGIFGRAASTSFIDVDNYNANRQEGEPPKLPAHFRFALQVHPDSTAWSIVAAWRDAEERPCLGVLATGPSTLGAYAAARSISLKYKQAIVFDVGQSSTASVMAENDRRRPKAKTQPLQWADVADGCSKLYAEILNRRLVHWGHEGMDAAVLNVVKRGTKNSKRWGFGRKDEEDPEQDITTIEAGALALRAYDKTPAVQKREVRGILS